MAGGRHGVRTSEVFAAYTRHELQELFRSADVVDLEPGERLVASGTRNAGCYLLLTGAVVTTTAQEARLTATPGEFVGLAETVVDAAARGDTVALRPSMLLAFAPRKFLGALDRVRPLRHAALVHLARATFSQCSPPACGAET